MNRKIKKMIKGEEGAVTVDWVVLSAAVIGLAMIMLMPIAYTTDNASSFVADYIRGQDVGYENLGD
jgi:hypothetical protein